MGIVCLGASSTLLCEEDRSNALGLVGCCDELVEVGSVLDGLDSAAGAVFPVDTVTDEAVSALVAKEVLAATPSPSCKVRSVAFDFAVTGDDARRGVAATMEGRDVGVLVNNAGVTYLCAAYFHEVEASVWEAVARVNVEAAAGEVGSSAASSAVRSSSALGSAFCVAVGED